MNNSILCEVVKKLRQGQLCVKLKHASDERGKDASKPNVESLTTIINN